MGVGNRHGDPSSNPVYISHCANTIEKCMKLTRINRRTD